MTVPYGQVENPMTEIPEQHSPISPLGAQTALSKISNRRIGRDDQNCRAIFVFPNHEAAILAFDQLILAGFSRAKVLIVGKEWLACDEFNHNTDNHNAYPVEHRKCVSARVFIGNSGAFKIGWSIGSMVGGIVGFALGLSITAMPGVNGAMLVSKCIYIFSSGLFCTISGGVIGTGIGLKIAQHQLKQYAKRVAQGEYLLIVSGTADTTRHAKQLMKSYLQNSDF